MIKNITIGVLIVVSVICLIYSFFQNTAANRSRLIAEQHVILAAEARAEADKQSMLAAEARVTLTNAQEDLKKCKASK